MLGSIYTHRRNLGAFEHTSMNINHFIENIAELYTDYLVDSQQLGTSASISHGLASALRSTPALTRLKPFGFYPSTPLVHACFSKIDEMDLASLQFSNNSVGVLSHQLFLLAIISMAQAVLPQHADNYLPKLVRKVHTLKERVAKTSKVPASGQVADAGDGLNVIPRRDPVLSQNELLRYMLEYKIRSQIKQFHENIISSYRIASNILNREFEQSGGTTDKTLRQSALDGILDSAYESLYNLENIDNIYNDWLCALEQFTVHELIEPAHRHYIVWSAQVPPTMTQCLNLQYGIAQERTALCVQGGATLPLGVTEAEKFSRLSYAQGVLTHMQKSVAAYNVDNGMHIPARLSSFANALEEAASSEDSLIRKMTSDEYMQCFSKNSVRTFGERFIVKSNEKLTASAVLTTRLPIEDELLVLPKSWTYLEDGRLNHPRDIAISFAGFGSYVDETEFATSICEWGKNSLAVQTITRNVPTLNEWNFHVPSRLKANNHSVRFAIQLLDTPHFGGDWFGTMDALIPDDLELPFLSAFKIGTKSTSRKPGDKTLTAQSVIDIKQKELRSTNVFALSNREAWLLANAVGGYDARIHAFRFNDPRDSMGHMVNLDLMTTKNTIVELGKTTDIEMVLHFANDWQGSKSFINGHNSRFLISDSGLQSDLPTLPDTYELGFDISFDGTKNSVALTWSTNDLLDLRNGNIRMHHPMLFAELLRRVFINRVNYHMASGAAQKAFIPSYSAKLNLRLAEYLRNNGLRHFMKWIPTHLAVSNIYSGMTLSYICRQTASLGLSTLFGTIDVSDRIDFKNDIDMAPINAASEHQLTKLFKNWSE